MYQSVRNPVAWTLAAAYILAFAWTAVQVASILRARHNPRSFLFAFLVLVVVYIPLRAAIFFADNTDSTSPVIILFLLPISLQFASFSIWALWFSTMEGGWRSVGCSFCRLPLNFWVYIAANVACLVLNSLVIVLTLQNNFSAAVIQVSIRLQQGYTGAAFLALAVLLAMYAVRFSGLSDAQYNRSVLPQQPRVLLLLTSALVAIFAVRAMYEILAASAVWSLPPFPPLRWFHALFFVLFDLLPVLVCLSLTYSIPAPPAADVPWGGTGAKTPWAPPPGGAAGTSAALLHATLLPPPEVAPDGAPPPAAAPGPVPGAASLGSGPFGGVLSTLYGVQPHPEDADSINQVYGRGASLPAPRSGVLGRPLPKVQSRDSLASASSAGSSEETRLMLPGAYRVQVGGTPASAGQVRLAVVPAGHSLPAGGLGGASWGAGALASSWGGHGRRLRSTSGSSGGNPTPAGAFDGGAHLQQVDRYDVPVDAAGARHSGRRGGSMTHVPPVSTLAPAAVAARARRGPGQLGISAPGPGQLSAGLESGLSMPHLAAGSPAGMSRADAAGVLYAEDSPSAANLLGSALASKAAAAALTGARHRSEGKRKPYNRACEQCSRVKKKCDGGRPCSRCARLGLDCCDKVDHRFAVHKRERERFALPGEDGGAPPAPKRAAMGAVPTLHPTHLPPPAAAPSPAAETAALQASLAAVLAAGSAASAAPTATTPRPAAPASLQQAALLSLGLGLPSLLGLTRAGAEAGGADPQAVLAALANPNTAIAQLLQRNVAATVRPGAPQPGAGAAEEDEGPPPAQRQGTPSDAASLSSASSAGSSARLERLLADTTARDEARAAHVAANYAAATGQGPPPATDWVPSGITGRVCVLRDVTGSLELPAGLEGEDPMVHHSATLVLSMCPMPTCRFVLHGASGLPLSVHANRGIAGMFNWCMHDLITPAEGASGFMTWIEPGALAARLQAAVAAKTAGLSMYSVRSSCIRPVADSPGGWFDPVSARFERFHATEVIELQRASNGNVIMTTHMMDIRPAPPGHTAVSDAEKLAALGQGKRLGEVLDAAMARLRASGAAAPAVQPPRLAAPPAAPRTGKPVFATAREAWTAAQGSERLAPPPLVYEARTSLHVGRVKSLVSTNHRALGVKAYLAYLAAIVWSAHPDVLAAFSAPPKRAVHIPPGHEPQLPMPNFRAAGPPPSVGVVGDTTFSATGARDATAPPPPAPPSAAPSLDKLGAAAEAALAMERAAAAVQGVPGGSTGSSVGAGVPASRVWAAMSVGGSVGGMPPAQRPVGGGSGSGGLDSFSVSAYSVDSSFSTGATGLFDTLMHPMAAGGMRAHPTAPPGAPPGALPLGAVTVDGRPADIDGRPIPPSPRSPPTPQ